MGADPPSPESRAARMPSISSDPLRPPFLFVVAVLLGVSLTACKGDGGGRNIQVTNPRLLQTPNGERIFAATLVNQRTSTIPIAEIEVGLYDADGSRIETMRIQVQDVPPQDSTEFKQTINSDRPIQQAQVQNILVP